MRLIDADTLLAEYDKIHIGEPGRARKLIAEQPTIDAVEVVRCRDCKWFDPKHPCGTIEPLAFKCRRYGTFHIPGFFCGDGERRKSWQDPSHPCADSVMMGD